LEDIYNVIHWNYIVSEIEVSKNKNMGDLFEKRNSERSKIEIEQEEMMSKSLVIESNMTSSLYSDDYDNDNKNVD
jgi:adenylate kinase family enzyme